MNLQPLSDLVTRWRADADRFRQLGDEARAVHCERYALELETRLHEWEAEPLTLEAAAAESGYGYSALQKRLARGDLENVGEQGWPRVRRGDLPHKGRRPELTEAGDPDLASFVLRRRALG